jgi:hypothetical protein
MLLTLRRTLIKISIPQGSLNYKACRHTFAAKNSYVNIANSPAFEIYELDDKEEGMDVYKDADRK